MRVQKWQNEGLYTRVSFRQQTYGNANVWKIFGETTERSERTASRKRELDYVQRKYTDIIQLTDLITLVIIVDSRSAIQTHPRKILRISAENDITMYVSWREGVDLQWNYDITGERERGGLITAINNRARCNINRRVFMESHYWAMIEMFPIFSC